MAFKYIHNKLASWSLGLWLRVFDDNNKPDVDRVYLLSTTRAMIRNLGTKRKITPGRLLRK